MGLVVDAGTGVRVSPEIAGPITSADRAYMSAKIASALAGAFQVWNRRYSRRSSGTDITSPRTPNSRFPPTPVTNAAPAMMPTWCRTWGTKPIRAPNAADSVRNDVAR